MRTLLLLLTLPPLAHAGDHYIFSGAHPDHAAATTQAATQGGWVLDTDLYPSLTPGLHAVVRGPFDSAEAARKAHGPLLASTDAYLKDAGDSILAPAAASRNLPGGILEALLGELHVEAEDRPGGANPCEPQQPYRRITVSWMRPQRGGPDGTQVTAVPQPLELGLFAYRPDTGVVERMRACWE